MLDKELLFNEMTIDQMVVSRVYSNAKSKEKLGFRPKWTMKEAIEDAIDARKRSGRLATYLIAPVYAMVLFVLVSIFSVIILLILLV